MGKSIKNFAHSVVSYVRHPFGVTCLDCGFLAIGQQEVDTSDRILLHCRGTAGCPPLEKLMCFRSLWVYFDLTYCGVPPADEIFDMVQKQQRNCKGYFRYMPGWSPSGHQELLLKALEWKQKFRFAVLGAVLGSGLTLLATWMGKLLGLI